MEVEEEEEEVEASKAEKMSAAVAETSERRIVSAETDFAAVAAFVVAAADGNFDDCLPCSY